MWVFGSGWECGMFCPVCPGIYVQRFPCAEQQACHAHSSSAFGGSRHSVDAFKAPVNVPFPGGGEGTPRTDFSLLVEALTFSVT